jgi:hypothetical protein
MAEYVKGMVRHCLGETALLSRITFVTSKPGQRMRDALNGHADGSESSYFDYVEYNNGLSLGSSYHQDLQDLQEVK